MGGPGSGAKPKIDTPALVAQVASLYASGLTQHEVALALGLSQKSVFGIMRRNEITPRVAAKRNQAGPANHSWKGASAGYKALHLRVAVTRGKPSLCSQCGRSDAGVVYDWANLTGRYDDVNDYERMCRPCHRQFDNAR